MPRNSKNQNNTLQLNVDLYGDSNENENDYYEGKIGSRFTKLHGKESFEKIKSKRIKSQEW